MDSNIIENLNKKQEAQFRTFLCLGFEHVWLRFSQFVILQYAPSVVSSEGAIRDPRSLSSSDHMLSLEDLRLGKSHAVICPQVPDDTLGSVTLC